MEKSTRTAKRSRSSPTAFCNGQPVELALCRRHGATMHLGDLMFVHEVHALRAKVSPIIQWHVTGPFPSPTPGRIGFEMTTPVEDAFAALGSGCVDLAASYKAGDKMVLWQPVQGDAEGVVDLDLSLGQAEWSAAYGYTEIDSPADRAVMFGLGSDDSMKVWLNGQVVHVYPSARTCLRKMGEVSFASPVQDFATLRLRRGVNRLLIRVNNFTKSWGFVAGMVKEDRT